MAARAAKGLKQQAILLPGGGRELPKSLAAARFATMVRALSVGASRLANGTPAKTVRGSGAFAAG